MCTYDIWPVALRGERGLRVLEDGVQREVCGDGEHGLTLCAAQQILLGRLGKNDEMGWACGTYGGEEEDKGFWWWKPDGKGPLGRPGRRWEDRIKIIVRQMGWKIVEWINVAENRDSRRAVVNTVMNL